jgi:hypothetical protein
MGMKTYEFSAHELAKLTLLLTELTAFHHRQDRSEEELRAFSAELYPLLREVQYVIVGGKLSDHQHRVISERDPFGLPHDEAIALLTKMLSG